MLVAQTPNTITKQFTLNNKYGLHARPSSLLVKAASKYGSEVKVLKDDLTGNGKSIMELMILAAAPGDTVTVTICGDDAKDAMGAIEELFESNFGEDHD